MDVSQSSSDSTKINLQLVPKHPVFVVGVADSPFPKVNVGKVHEGQIRCVVVCSYAQLPPGFDTKTPP